MQRLGGDRESRYTLRIPSHREVTFLPQKRRLLALLFLGEVICDVCRRTVALRAPCPERVALVKVGGDSPTGATNPQHLDEFIAG